MGIKNGSQGLVTPICIHRTTKSLYILTDTYTLLTSFLKVIYFGPQGLQSSLKNQLYNKKKCSQTRTLLQNYISGPVHNTYLIAYVVITTRLLGLGLPSSFSLGASALIGHTKRSQDLFNLVFPTRTRSSISLVSEERLHPSERHGRASGTAGY